MSSPDLLSRSDKARISRLGNFLVDWYDQHGRDLPWRRKEASNYQRICVEVLLQRTKAETVAAHYDRFFAVFPGWAEIDQAREDQLREVLRPLGLWKRRAISLKGLARFVQARRGEFPRSRRALDEAPAVGQYVGNSIELFAHGARRPLLDINMARVLERYVRPRTRVDLRNDPFLQAASAWLVRRHDPVTVNWATLDFAASTCKARTPLCDTCGLRIRCAFRNR